MTREEELAELQEQIVAAQAERRRAQAEFDRFISTFRTEGEPEASDVAIDAPPAPLVRSEVRSAGVDLPLESLDVAFDSLPEVPVPPAEPPPVVEVARPRRTSRWVAGAAVIVVAGVAGATVFALRERRTPSQPPDAEPARPAVTAPQNPPPAPPAVVPVQQPPKAAPAPPAGVNLEITAQRRVWLRATVDGRRAFERMLNPGERVPLHADQSIVLRAGDAGAVSLMRDGRDAGLLGRDGMIANREFTLR